MRTLLSPIALFCLLVCCSPQKSWNDNPISQNVPEDTMATNPSSPHHRLTFSVLQMNVWEDLSNLSGGRSTTRQAFYDILCEIKPDIAMFCELNSGNDILGEACKQLKGNTGETYSYSHLYGSGGRGMLTKFPIIERSSEVESLNGGHNQWFYRMIVNISGAEVALYASHAYHANYSCYLPRGYDGNTWQKIDNPITDVDAILEEEEKSGRPNIADDFIADCNLQKNIGRLCIFAGDLNEPSHLDWVEQTKNLYEHNGCVIPWPISIKMTSAGIKDAFRQVWPDPLINYGITWPVYNPDAVKKTQWADESDDRDRIDYVYYSDDIRLRPIEAKLIGPKETISHSSVDKDILDDSFIIVPKAKWPSDHRGILITFELDIL